MAETGNHYYIMHFLLCLLLPIITIIIYHQPGNLQMKCLPTFMAVIGTDNPLNFKIYCH